MVSRISGQLLDRPFEQCPIVTGDVQRAAERRHLVDAGARTQCRGERRQVRAGHRPRDELCAGHDLGRGAGREQPSFEDVREAVAALGLVHVMGRDEHGDALSGQLVDLVPEVAARLRIDARRRFVQQQQLRAVQHARGESEPLLPAAGELARKLVAARAEPEPVDRRPHDLRAFGNPVHSRDEIEVLADGQVFPQRKALRHVADLALDRVGLADHVEAEAGPAAVVRREQAAQHPDRCRLAAAVGSEKAVDLAALHLQREIPHDVLVAEMLVETMHVDGGSGHGRLTATSTGCPGRSRMASAAAGRASTRKTSFAFESRL